MKMQSPYAAPERPPILAGILSLESAPRAHDRAFTRTELLATVAALFLLGLVALPLLASSKPRSERMICLNSLGQIGTALHTWASDHGNDYPWHIPSVDPNGGPYGLSGGTRFHPLLGNSWFNFAWISNELLTPRILVCPSDSGRRIASDFTSSPTSGFLNANFRNSAVSYFIGLDAFNDDPRHMVAGDRNIRYSVTANCATGVFGVPSINARPDSSVLYLTKSIHGFLGNVLFSDGSVRELSNEGFTKALLTGDDNGSVHFLIP